jgi:hypothetical protein
MWPLSLVLLVATAAPQQGSSNLDGAYVGKVPQISSLSGHGLQTRRMSPDNLQLSNTCYTMRSYHFRRQDGQAPVLAGTTTCTPANRLQQRRVWRGNPGSMYVPLGLQTDNQK